MSWSARTSHRGLSKADFERLAWFRYQLRRFLRFSEEATRRNGVTSLQYQLMLQIRGFPGRDWATVGELAERLQAKHHGVVSLITRCEAAGLVKRSVSRRDRRRVEVRLTRKGEACLTRLAGLHQAELLTLARDADLRRARGALRGGRGTGGARRTKRRSQPKQAGRTSRAR